ncbi:MAG: carbohydrate-binding domain-containing protein [Prevotellaceae bacterium]|nr:carbohydrate-binding domain-containing protein [Candidatus Faecinaster equi]
MKKILLIIIVFVSYLGTKAQSLCIYNKNNVTIVPAEEMGDITCEETRLIIGNTIFEFNDIDSIIISNQVYDVNTIKIEYCGEQAFVYTPLSICSNVSSTINGAYVSIISNVTDEPEITYHLSGTTNDGAFTQEGQYKCTLLLDGVSITSNKGAAIAINNGKRIDVELKEGTTNTLTDYALGEQKACFYIKGHAELKGEGTLNIIGNASHAYKSGEYTEIKKTFGTLNILGAVQDGLHVDQYFKINGGTINIDNVINDGIEVEKTDTPEDENNGNILLNDGKVTMTLNSDDVAGLKCDNDFIAKGGTYTITTNGKASKCVKVNNNAELSNENKELTFNLTANGGYIEENKDKKKSYCLKIDNNMTFFSGTINANANGPKSKGIKVGGDYFYTTKIKTNVKPEVDGSMSMIE